MGQILGLDGKTITPIKEEAWMPYREYLYQKLWMEVKEKEWWETRALGYAKCPGLNTLNRERSENFEKYFEEELAKATKEQEDGKKESRT